MNQGELIPIVPGTIGSTHQLTVDARALHAVLHVKRDFSNWIKERISKYDFVENQDFLVFAKTGENPDGGRPSREYHLSLSMGKELAMVENNEHGRLVRRYFIECERRALQRQAAFPAASVRFSLSTSEERQPLRELVSEWVKLTGMISGKAWGRINERFKLRQIGDLPREMVPEAMDFVRERIEFTKRAMLPEEAPTTARPDSQPTVPLSEPTSTFELVSPPAREARKEASVDFPRRVMALPAGRPQDGFDQNELDSALRRAEDLNSSYSMAMRDLVEELRMPFGAARQDDQLPERVRTFATSVMYGLSDMQTACTLIHNAVLSSVRMAADGCRVLSETR